MDQKCRLRAPPPPVGPLAALANQMRDRELSSNPPFGLAPNSLSGLIGPA